MHTGWKSRGGGTWCVLPKSLGRGQGFREKFPGGSPYFGFYCILNNKFFENLPWGCCFIPPHPPLPVFIYPILVQQISQSDPDSYVHRLSSWQFVQMQKLNWDLFYNFPLYISTLTTIISLLQIIKQISSHARDDSQHAIAILLMYDFLLFTASSYLKCYNPNFSCVDLSWSGLILAEY